MEDHETVNKHRRICQNTTRVMYSSRTSLILGHTFLISGDNGNIGHCLQRLMCDAAAKVEARTVPYSVTMNWESLDDNTIVSLVVKTITDTISISQNPIPLMRFERLRHLDILCFERLIFQRPDPCDPHSLTTFPSNQEETLTKVRSMLFRRMNISRKIASIDPCTNTSCVKHMVIYDRNNREVHRILNSVMLQNTLVTHRCLNVTVIHDIPVSAIDQEFLINSADLFITSHSTTASLSFLLPDAAWLIEIGQITWVKDALMLYFPLFYQLVDFGLDLEKYNPDFDRLGHRESERSFTLNSHSINAILGIVQYHACSCI